MFFEILENVESNNGSINKLYLNNTTIIVLHCNGNFKLGEKTFFKATFCIMGKYIVVQRLEMHLQLKSHFIWFWVLHRFTTISCLSLGYHTLYYRAFSQWQT